jgi:serine/threonine protein kinase
VVAEASRGDLNDYLPKYGRMEEKVARSFFRQLVEALQALGELQPPLLHPNLLASSLLLGDDGAVRVCGWS